MSRLRYIAFLAVAVLGLAVFFGLRTLRDSCFGATAYSDAPTVRGAEAALLLREATALYKEQQDYRAPQDPALPRPLKAQVSGRIATLRVSDAMYAGDYRYAQLWQQVYRRYHNNEAPCVKLQVLWKNGGTSQHFPPDA